MLKNHYNTIIIGAGPAGLACALTLLENGVDDVLVAEKHEFPRDKCCAGYITRKTEKKYRRFGFDPADCGYSLIEDFGLYFRLKRRQRIENRFLFTSREINRVALDDAFFRLAKARGVNIAENMPITGHDPDNNTVTLGKTHVAGYDNLVFADGTMGFGSAYQRAKRRNLAMQCIFTSDRPDGIEIHFGVTRHGYCWVSTLRGVTNVGMTDEYREAREYKKIFENFLRELGLNADTSALYSAFTPIGIRKPVIGKNIFFAGDAMGACDPFTLSGISCGLDSGEKAALSITRSDTRIIERYAHRLGVKFTFMRLLMRIFYIPCVRWLVFNVGCRFLSGVVTFFFNRFLNKK
ncbi:MAG: NAD(P)/FAD-dependent oxidoreductase [Oscillospiraceae bacterium]|nr:NAD(P)/FAD-dependent oxidoreductase [Oscillospiraceae bacterium]